MLELHHVQLRDGEEGPLPERPLLAPWLRRAERDGELLLEYGDEILAVEGDLSLLASLDGTRRLSELSPRERAAATAYLAIRFLMRFFHTNRLTPFAIYCLVAGFASLIYFVS